MPESLSKPASFPSRAHRIAWFALLALVLVVVVGIRLRLLSTPLERDEGEYAYGGQLLLQGLPPYEGMYTMKWPGTHYAYAAIMAVFGETPAGIHFGLILVNLLTAALVFRLAQRAAGGMAAAAATAAYALLSISPVMMGFAAHATHFVMLPAMAGILLLQGVDERTSRSRIFLAGVLLGVAGLMKQSGAVFGLFGVAWLMWQEAASPARASRRLLARLGLLAVGGALPVAALCLMLAVDGVFGKFWLWTFEYARTYAAQRTPIDGLADLGNVVVWLFRTAAGLWAAAALGAVCMVFEKSFRRLLPFVFGLALFSMLGVCPGWYFRGHYFIFLLPAAGLLLGFAAQAIYQWISRWRSPGQGSIVALLLVAGAFSWTLYQSRNIFFRIKAQRFWGISYTPTPFGEAVLVGDYLRSHCPPGERIAVLGSEPEIYFYSHRRAATGYIYMYPLMEPQPFALAMQQQMIREIESANPAYVVWVEDPYSWLQRKDSPVEVFNWFRTYGARHLQPVGWLDMTRPPETEFHPCAPGEMPAPRSRSWVAVFKRVPADGNPSRTGTSKPPP